MANRTAVFVTSQGVTSAELSAVAEGVREMIVLSGRSMGVGCAENWRSRNYQLTDGSLKPFESNEWFCASARRLRQGRHQLDAEQFLLKLHREPSRVTDPHLDVVIVAEDLFFANYNFVAGLGTPEVGAVLSTFRFASLGNTLGKLEVLKSLAMHEFGHILGLPNGQRKVLDRDYLGRHCTNRCIMRQGSSVPCDWNIMTRDRLHYGALCNDCRRELGAR